VNVLVIDLEGKHWDRALPFHITASEPIRLTLDLRSQTLREASPEAMLENAEVFILKDSLPTPRGTRYGLAIWESTQPTLAC